ncbi:MAG: hypothetical protein PHT51_03945 [Patescibacteria group bacterium]|nr:hypothetical protein [Patescibacteria group bacterium]MDD4610418.1 hypothetical protein [Patescibacteria group bacterium]
MNQKPVDPKVIQIVIAAILANMGTNQSNALYVLKNFPSLFPPWRDNEVNSALFYRAAVESLLLKKLWASDAKEIIEKMPAGEQPVFLDRLLIHAFTEEGWEMALKVIKMLPDGSDKAGYTETLARVIVDVIFDKTWEKDEIISRLELTLKTVALLPGRGEIKSDILKWISKNSLLWGDWQEVGIPAATALPPGTEKDGHLECFALCAIEMGYLAIAAKVIPLISAARPQKDLFSLAFKKAEQEGELDHALAWGKILNKGPDFWKICKAAMAKGKGEVALMAVQQIEKGSERDELILKLISFFLDGHLQAQDVQRALELAELLFKDEAKNFSLEVILWLCLDNGWLDLGKITAEKLGRKLQYGDLERLFFCFYNRRHNSLAGALEVLKEMSPGVDRENLAVQFFAKSVAERNPTLAWKVIPLLPSGHPAKEDLESMLKQCLERDKDYGIYLGLALEIAEKLAAMEQAAAIP